MIEMKPNNAGGVAIATRNDITKHTEDIEMEKDQDAEIAWIRLKTCQGKVHIGGYYGKQEGEKKDKVEHEYSQLNTQIIRLKKEGNVVLVGDFNAKLPVRTHNITQQVSRNGRILQRTIDTTGLEPVNTEAQFAKWTRVNRNNQNEKSIIDYLLTDGNMRKDLTEVSVDEEGNHRPRGKNETDHNTIIAKFKIQARKNPPRLTTWNIDNQTDWKKYNRQIETIPATGNYQELIAGMKEALNIVAKKKKSQNKKRLLSPEANFQRKIMKHAKKLFEFECKSNGTEKRERYEAYISARQKLERLIEAHQKTRATETANKLIKEGGVRSTYFWRLRNKLTGTKQPEYELVTEEGTKIYDPDAAKEEIAKYYEQLYCPRPGIEGYENWTRTITKDYEDVRRKMTETPRATTITKKELNEAIKRTKDNKAPGPDDIPNEAIKNMNHRNREKLRKALNNIMWTGNIPQDWTGSYITRLYKGKGQKGKCSSERGITLSSNIGKMFERIINERITEKVIITDEQAGGRKRRSTTDHINVLHNIIANNKKRKQPTYIVFLDVTKAYDKAWLKAIMHVLYKQGITDKTWDITDKLNQNLQAKIRTKYGLTRTIHINDSIRQGGVLSVIQYALIMDEISKTNKMEDIGEQIPGTESRINTLLWMDDVALIANNLDDLKKLINNTNHTANKYHIEFGKEKSKVLRIGKHPKNQPEQEQLYLGSMELEYTDKYKYLGLTINEKLNLSDHIKSIKGKTEAAYQTILSLLHDRTFLQIQMKTAWKLLETCIIPVITYASETWMPTKKEIKTLNKILDDIIKRILMTPISTPREALYLDTNLLDIERIIDKKKLNMYHRMKKNPTSLTDFVTQGIEKTKWQKDVEETARKYNINLNRLTEMTTGKAKRHIRKTVQKKFREHLFENSEQKSKIEYLIKGYVPCEKAEYTNILNREQTSIIFKARCRMTEVKNNYRNRFNDITCRLCKEDNEDQEHIFEKCPEVIKNNLNFDIVLLHSQAKPILENVADKIKKITEMLQN